MNVASNLARAARYFPDRPAVCERDRVITYAELNSLADRICAGLRRQGISPGDPVALCMGNWAEWIACYFGVLKTGAVVVTLSSLLSPDELSLLIHHARPRFVFCESDRRAEMERHGQSAGIAAVIAPGAHIDLTALLKEPAPPAEIIERHRSDTAAVLYTGGTTGAPKGVMLSHENINTSAHNVSFSERSTENDQALCFLPLNHVFGQIHIMNATIFSCGCLELLRAYDMDRVLELTGSGQITKLYAVPTVYTRLLDRPDLRKELGRVRYCFSAAAVMAAEIVKLWKDRTGLTIAEGYGMTESASAVTYNHYYRHVVGSVGTVVPGVEIQIRDDQGLILPEGREGEICICGRNIMNGYLNNPEDTKSAFWDDGWFRSGDVGVIDSEGYLYIVDRLKDMIITGGENVYPREVEEVLYTRPDIQECAVIGAPDREWGERVIAYVSARPGYEISPVELKAFLKARLAPFKVPKEFVVVSDIPKNAAGKILKRELRRQFGSDLRDRKESES